MVAGRERDRGRGTTELRSAKALDRLIDDLVGRALAEGLQLAGGGGLLQQLTRVLPEFALEGGITDHLGRVLSEIKNRGVNDVLMLVCDGLNGLLDAIEGGLVPHRSPDLRGHLLGSPSAMPPVRTGARSRMLEPVYAAVTEEAALERFAQFADGWGMKSPALVRLWETTWEEFAPSFRFDTKVRRVVCTTKPIESVNARIWRAVKARGHFPNETAALMCIDMAIVSPDPTGKGLARNTYSILQVILFARSAGGARSGMGRAARLKVPQVVRQRLAAIRADRKS